MSVDRGEWGFGNGGKEEEGGKCRMRMVAWMAFDLV